jgi:hypothetical protein
MLMNVSLLFSQLSRVEGEFRLIHPGQIITSASESSASLWKDPLRLKRQPFQDAEKLMWKDPPTEYGGGHSIGVVEFRDGRARPEGFESSMGSTGLERPAR